MNELCEHGSPVRPGKPFTLDQCRVCWINSGGDRTKKVAKEPEAECDHLGKPVPPPAGKDVRKVWRLCLHPAKPLGAVVCGCVGCGRKCSGYTQEQ
jgi:hypothetical protein